MIFHFTFSYTLFLMAIFFRITSYFTNIMSLSYIEANYIIEMKLVTSLLKKHESGFLKI